MPFQINTCKTRSKCFYLIVYGTVFQVQHQQPLFNFGKHTGTHQQDPLAVPVRIRVNKHGCLWELHTARGYSQIFISAGPGIFPTAFRRGWAHTFYQYMTKGSCTWDWCRGTVQEEISIFLSSLGTAVIRVVAYQINCKLLSSLAPGNSEH